MRVHAVGRAGYQGHEVTSRLQVQQVRLLGQDGVHLADLVREHFVEHVDIELVSDRHLVKPSKELRRRQASMTGKKGMRAFASYRKRRTLHVTHGVAQHRIAHAVVHRQLDVELWYGHVRHDTRARNVQALLVLAHVLVGQRELVWPARE